MLDQVTQHGVGKAVLIRPLRIAEDAVQLLWICGLDGTHGGLDGLPDVVGGLAGGEPVRIARNLEAVILGIGSKIEISTGLRESRFGLLIKDVAEPLIEQQWENELLVVAGVDGPTQEHGGAPEVRFELLLRNGCAHADLGL